MIVHHATDIDEELGVTELVGSHARRGLGQNFKAYYSTLSLYLDKSKDYTYDLIHF